MLNSIKELNNEIHNAFDTRLRDYPDFIAEVKQLNKTAKLKAKEVDEIVEICRSNGFGTTRTGMGDFRNIMFNVPEYGTWYTDDYINGLSYMDGRIVKQNIRHYLVDVSRFETAVYVQLKNRRDASIKW